MTTKTTRLLTGIILFVILASSVVVSNGQAFLTNGLVAYYPLDSSAIDVSGLHNDGVIGGTILPVADRFGQSGGALAFGGILDNALFGSPLSIISISNASTFDFSGDFTICGWVDITNATPQFSIFLTSGYDLGVTSSSNSPAMYLTMTVSQSPSNQVDLTAQQYLPQSAWTHVVGRLENHKLSLFQNGSLVGQSPAGVGIDYSGGTWADIGENFYSYVWLDDIRVYNRGLSDADIQQLYAFESGTNYTACPRSAQATATTINGFVVAIDLADGGCGYEVAEPIIEILGGGGTGASATALVTNGVITAIKVTSAGSGYTNVPIVLILPPSQPLTISTPYSCTAAADSTVVNGFVVQINITDGGCGYTNAPVIQILGGGGFGATATCVVSNGSIASITVNQAGTGYTNTPTVYIASPELTRVRLTQTMIFGHSYALETSTDLQNWTTLESLTATYTGVVQQQVPVDKLTRFFRTRLVN